MIIIIIFNLGITILNTKKYLDIYSNILITLKNNISKGLIINVIKLNGYTIRDIIGTTTILFNIANIFI